MVTPIDVPATTEIASADEGVSETVLGKRRRKRYGAYRNRLAGPNDDDTVAVNYPRRGERQPRPESWRQRGPQRGPAVHLPPRPKQQPRVNPRRWDAERGGSRPRWHKDFTINPCWDLVSRRGRWEPTRMDNRHGQRRERRRKRGTMEAAAALLCHNIHAGCCSRPSRPTWSAEPSA